MELGCGRSEFGSWLKREAKSERVCCIDRRGNVSANRTGQCAGHCQPQSESTVIVTGGVFPPEWLEEVRYVFLSNAWCRITDLDHNAVLSSAASDQDGVTRGGRTVSNGVVEKISDDRSEQRDIYASDAARRTFHPDSVGVGSVHCNGVLGMLRDDEPNVCLDEGTQRDVIRAGT